MQPIRIDLPTNLGVGPVNAYLFTQPEVVLVDAGIKSAECWFVTMLAVARRARKRWMGRAQSHAGPKAALWYSNT